jgi:transcriptional regulator with XRE-family HTH domain
MTEVVVEQRDVIPPWTQGWRLQRALSHAGMTTEQMADELGVARSTVSRWCNDKGHITRGYLTLWALHTGVSFDWLADEPNSRDIPTGREQQPPSTAEIKAIRRRIPLRAPRMEPLLRLVAA